MPTMQQTADFLKGAIEDSPWNKECRDAALRAVNSHEALLQACSALCLAYMLGEENGGYMKWEHVDEAWELAKAALEKAGLREAERV